MIVLDGHGSRFELPFLEHVTHENHHWVCCVGAPHGTHIWQVGDASELNGTLKVIWCRVKGELIEAKKRPHMPQTLSAAGVIPLINKCSLKGKKAIVERGWNPMNEALLKNPDLILTKTKPRVSGASVATVASPSATQASAVARDLNLDHRAAAASIDVIANHRDGQEARRRKMEATQQATDANTQLKNAKRIASGVCVGAGEHELNGNLASHAGQRTEDKNEAPQAKAARKES